MGDFGDCLFLVGVFSGSSSFFDGEVDGVWFFLIAVNFDLQGFIVFGLG